MAHTGGQMLPAADDPQLSFLIQSWSRMCRSMGKNFAQHLPMVMGPVMWTAAMQPEVIPLGDDYLEDNPDWQFVSLGEQQNFGIKTAVLENKASACEMLLCVVRELKEAFAEYAEYVVKLMVPMLKFYFHDRVRKAAAKSLPRLLKCARIRGDQYIEGMWAYIQPELINAIDSEPEPKVQYGLLKSLAECLLYTGHSYEHYITKILHNLNKLLTEHFQRATEYKDNEVVEEQLEDDIEHDDYIDHDDILWSVAAVLRALLSAYHESFFPHLDTLLPHLVALMAPGRPFSDRICAFHIFEEVIEFGGPACVKYQDIFLEPMLNGLWSQDVDVREAAAHSCGVLAQFGGPQFADACARAVPQLAAIVAEPEVRSVETAISAVSKIIKYNHSKINRDEIIRHWLTWLPVVEDTVEAPDVYLLLCELAAAGHPALEAQHVIAILAEAFLRDAVPEDSDVFSQMVALVRRIQTNAELFNSCLMQLSNEHKEALQQALTQVA